MKSIEERKYILFDLDGTLTDPMVGITKSAQHALKHYGILVEDHKSLCFFIGPPLKDTFMKEYGFSEEQAEEAVFVFREYFVPRGIFENKIYPGMAELLRDLKAAGRKLLVATSKPEVFAKQILQYFHIEEYFTFVAGSILENEHRSRKEEVIAYAMEQSGITDADDMVMVGDRKFDMEGAKAIGAAAVGVLYGYGGEEELLHADADAIVNSVEELRDVLLAPIKRRV